MSATSMTGFLPLNFWQKKTESSEHDGLEIAIHYQNETGIFKGLIVTGLPNDNNDMLNLHM